MPASTRWAIRSLVLGALAITLWLCGPRAVAVLAARFEQAERNSAPVVLDRVGFAATPQWMDRALLLAVSSALSPWLADEVPILDETTGRQLRDGLTTVPWVRSVEIQRVFPDRFRLEVELRRPLLAVRASDGVGLCLVDRDAVMLPWVETPLPVTFLHREGGSPTMPVAEGEPASDARVRAAVGVVVEWREQLLPLVPAAAPLIEVDATNLGERWLSGPSYPEIRVTLRRRDGAGVVFGYGRPVDTTMSRVPVPTKATVLNKILERHPGLDGLIAGDLRFATRWVDYLQPRAANVHDPNEPWNELLPK